MPNCPSLKIPRARIPFGLGTVAFVQKLQRSLSEKNGKGLSYVSGKHEASMTMIPPSPVESSEWCFEFVRASLGLSRQIRWIGPLQVCNRVWDLFHF